MRAMADRPAGEAPPLWCNGGRHPVHDPEEFHWKNKAAGVRHDTCKRCFNRFRRLRWQKKHPQAKRKRKLSQQ